MPRSDHHAGDAAIAWLLHAAQPAVRRRTLTGLLGRRAGDPEVATATSALPDDPWVAALLPTRYRTAVAPLHPYVKWRGAHWRLVALADLCGGAPRPPGAVLEAAVTALDADLGWLLGAGRARRLLPVEGRVRICGSQDGNALWAACRLGIADRPEVEALAARLVAWQWPDGGWNCDPRPTASHSSVNETLPPLRGLAGWAHRTGDPAAAAASDRAAEFLLRHRVVLSERSGAPIHPSVLAIGYPPYWRYDLLGGLLGLAEAGVIRDPRASDALAILEAKRRPNGRWAVDRRWWRRPGSTGANVEVVDWETGESRMATLLALEVLAAAGRFSSV